MTSHLSAPSFPDRIDRAISIKGYSVVSIGYGECLEPACRGCAEDQPWTYTVGLSAYGLAELVLMGLDPMSAHFALSWVAEERRCSRVVATDQPFELRGIKSKLVTVPDEWLLTDPSRMAVWFHQQSAAGTWRGLPRVEQLVWADSSGRFPDDASQSVTALHRQPVLRDDPFSQPHRRPSAGKRLAEHHLQVA